MPIAIIPAGTQVFDSDSGKSVITGQDIKTNVRITLEDVEVAEYSYNGRNYTVDTSKVKWKITW